MIGNGLLIPARQQHGERKEGRDREERSCICTPCVYGCDATRPTLLSPTCPSLECCCLDWMDGWRRWEAKAPKWKEWMSPTGIFTFKCSKT